MSLILSNCFIRSFKEVGIALRTVRYAICHAYSASLCEVIVAIIGSVRVPLTFWVKTWGVLITDGSEALLTPLTGRPRVIHMRAIIDTATVPIRLRGIRLTDGVPIICFGHWTNATSITIRFPPSIRASQVAAGVDTTLVEVFHALPPFNNRESLKGRPCAQNGSLFFCRLQGHFDSFRKLRQHMVRCARFHWVPLEECSRVRNVLDDNMTPTQPGINPKPPKRLPTPSAPFLPNSTATRPKGSSRDGINAKSAPLKRYGGSAVNSGFENTRSGYNSMSLASFSAAKRPYRSMTGPTAMS